MKAFNIEWNLIKKNLLLVVYLTIITAIITIRTKSLLITAVTASIIIVAKIISVPFEVEESEKLTRFYKSLPIAYKDFVLSRYIILLVIGLVSINCAVIINYILLSLIGKTDITINLLFQAVMVGILIFILTLAIEVPFFYRHGAIKAKFASVVPALIFLGIYVIFNRMNLSDSVITLMYENSDKVIFALLMVTAIIGAFSYNVSTNIYKLKD